MTNHNPTLRVINILNLVSQKNELTLTEISNELEISKSTLQPILKTLANHGYLSQGNNNKTFKIGMSTFKIGQTFINDNNPYDVIRKSMKNIVSDCNEICQMGIYDENNPGHVLYIAKEEPLQSIALISNIGTSLPAHATALGKCLLAYFPKDYVKNLYSNGMEKLTENTISDLDTLLEEIKKVRINNFASECGESTEEIECIAVPLIQDNKAIASISVSLPMYRSSPEKISYIIDLLIKEKNNIDALLENMSLIF